MSQLMDNTLWKLNLFIYEHYKPLANNSHIVGLEMTKFEKHGQVMTWAKIASRRK
jgi:hypothetical protein